MLTRRKKIALGFVLVLSAYIGSYLLLSLNGIYEPGSIGLNGVKSYSWAPRGFVTDYKWHRGLMVSYFPLYLMDRRYWHTPDKANSGMYRVDRVSQEDIWKVYDAQGALEEHR